ncbi:mitochondrial 37S ribosomal protein mS42 [Limtongia smithiae]|uniref:mitochondrial 37S ribosomal protein mS42 n=1 Tax=Limtongia smithiae TaxID=1125753 RepID=UPI0034CE28C8
MASAIQKCRELACFRMLFRQFTAPSSTLRLASLPHATTPASTVSSSAASSSRILSRRLHSRSTTAAAVQLLRRPRVVISPASSASTGTRNIHIRPQLADEDHFTTTGVGAVFSPKAFALAWLEYQEYLTSQLTKRTVGTRYEGLSPFEITLATGRQTTQTPTFNFASLTHNNHFFFHTLKGPSSEPSTGPLQTVAAAIDRSFSSLDELKLHMSTVAQAMCGNGYVWLIEGPRKELYVLATYNAGTPYDYARAQDYDFNAPVDPLNTAAVADRENKVRAGGARSEPDWPRPLLCINVWEHTYLTDYGFDGKAAYFENWWAAIDWYRVEERLSSAEAFQQLNKDRETL